MCDTFGVLGTHKIFGKNSDRSPNEVQVVEYIPKHKTKSKNVSLTYIDIPEVEEVYSILISRPVWMWGAEMGVNEFGLVIGNEAIFTKGKYQKSGITGMDLVRLLLERCKSAHDAVKQLKVLIQKYGVGGNCGYDHNFFYNNSFLIMDRRQIFVVETTPKSFDVEEKKIANISNCITLSHSTIKEDFLYRFFSASRNRFKMVNQKLNKGIDVGDAFSILRSHKNHKYFSGSVGSVCMHAGKMIGDHTTNSMVVELLPKKINVYVTMGSCPCISLYKKWVFGEKVNYPLIQGNVDERYYREIEQFKRALKNKKIEDSFYQKRDLLESKIINDKISFLDSLKEEKKLYNSTENYEIIHKDNSYWKKKNKIYEEETTC